MNHLQESHGGVKFVLGVGLEVLGEVDDRSVRTRPAHFGEPVSPSLVAYCLTS